MDDALTRRGLLRAAAAGGLAAGLAACGTRPAPRPARPRPGLGPDYLAAGLMALSVAHERGWARGHHGAAVITAHYLASEHDLDERTRRAIRSQVDAFIAFRGNEFPALDPGPGSADVGPILEQLGAHVHELRSGGHDAIYASLALRALRDVPEFATPRVIDGIRRLLVTFVETLPVVEETPWQAEHPAEPYRDARALVRATNEAMLRPWESVAALGAGQVVHWVTHADAVRTLEELGHGDIARRGFAAHQRYIHHAWGEGSSSGPDAPRIDWLAPAYWESDAPRLPQKRTWFFGHAFKLPYSLLRNLREATGPAQRAACLHRAAELYAPFS